MQGEVCGEGRPVLVLHGWSLDRKVMMSCLESVFSNREGWQRIYVDLPGMGASPSDPRIQTTDDMVDALVSLVDEVIGKEPFRIFGASYGAFLARAMLRWRPEQVTGMMLLCPIVLADRTKRTLPKPQVIHADQALLTRLPQVDASSFSAMATVQDTYRWRRFQREVLPALKRADTPFLEGIRARGYGCSYDVDDLAKPFAGPVTIVAGRQDASVGYADAWRLSEHYPRATFAVLDRAAHLLQLEQPQLFRNLVLDWLDRNDHP